MPRTGAAVPANLPGFELNAPLEICGGGRAPERVDVELTDTGSSPPLDVPTTTRVRTASKLVVVPSVLLVVGHTYLLRARIDCGHHEWERMARYAVVSSIPLTQALPRSAVVVSRVATFRSPSRCEEDPFNALVLVSVRTPARWRDRQGIGHDWPDIPLCELALQLYCDGLSSCVGEEGLRVEHRVVGRARPFAAQVVDEHERQARLTAVAVALTTGAALLVGVFVRRRRAVGS